MRRRAAILRCSAITLDVGETSCDICLVMLDKVSVEASLKACDPPSRASAG